MLKWSWSKLNSLYSLQAMGHRRCSGLSGSLSVVVGFKCSRCAEGTGREETMKEVGVDHVGKLECVSEFCYS